MSESSDLIRGSFFFHLSRRRFPSFLPPFFLSFLPLSQSLPLSIFPSTIPFKFLSNSFSLPLSLWKNLARSLFLNLPSLTFPPFLFPSFSLPYLRSTPSSSSLSPFRDQAAVPEIREAMQRRITPTRALYLATTSLSIAGGIVASPFPLYSRLTIPYNIPFFLFVPSHHPHALPFFPRPRRQERCTFCLFLLRHKTYPITETGTYLAPYVTFSSSMFVTRPLCRSL